MTAPRSVASSIEVAVDPATAFQVFTEELDCWWIQGPINFFDPGGGSDGNCQSGSAPKAPGKFLANAPGAGRE